MVTIYSVNYNELKDIISSLIQSLRFNTESFNFLDDKRMYVNTKLVDIFSVINECDEDCTFEEYKIRVYEKLFAKKNFYKHFVTIKSKIDNIFDKLEKKEEKFQYQTITTGVKGSILNESVIYCDFSEFMYKGIYFDFNKFRSFLSSHNDVEVNLNIDHLIDCEKKQVYNYLMKYDLFEKIKEIISENVKTNNNEFNIIIPIYIKNKEYDEYELEEVLSEALLPMEFLRISDRVKTVPIFKDEIKDKILIHFKFYFAIKKAIIDFNKIFKDSKDYEEINRCLREIKIYWRSEDGIEKAILMDGETYENIKNTKIRLRKRDIFVKWRA